MDVVVQQSLAKFLSDYAPHQRLNEAQLIPRSAPQMKPSEAKNAIAERQAAAREAVALGTSTNFDAPGSMVVTA